MLPEGHINSEYCHCFIALASRHHNWLYHSWFPAKHSQSVLPITLAHAGSVNQPCHSFPRITSTVACDMDLTKYPMDEQECMLDLESCEFDYFPSSFLASHFINLYFMFNLTRVRKAFRVSHWGTNTGRLSAMQRLQIPTKTVKLFFLKFMWSNGEITHKKYR